MKERPLRHAVTLFVCTRDRGKKDDCCARFGGEKVLVAALDAGYEALVISSERCDGTFAAHASAGWPSLLG